MSIHVDESMIRFNVPNLVILLRNDLVELHDLLLYKITQKVQPQSGSKVGVILYNNLC